MRIVFLFFIQSIPFIFYLLIFPALITGVMIFLLKRKRFKVCDSTHPGDFSGARSVGKPGQKVLMEKSLYNEIIAVYNIFSHQLDNLDPGDLETFKISSSFALVKKAKYKLMTPGMEKDKLLFTIEEFKLLKAGLGVLDLFFINLHDVHINLNTHSPEFRLVQRVFNQLDIKKGTDYSSLP